MPAPIAMHHRLDFHTAINKRSFWFGFGRLPPIATIDQRPQGVEYSETLLAALRQFLRAQQQQAGHFHHVLSSCLGHLIDLAVRAGSLWLMPNQGSDRRSRKFEPVGPMTQHVNCPMAPIGQIVMPNSVGMNASANQYMHSPQRMSQRTKK